MLHNDMKKKKKKESSAILGSKFQFNFLVPNAQQSRYPTIVPNYSNQLQLGYTRALLCLQLSLDLVRLLPVGHFLEQGFMEAMFSPWLHGQFYFNFNPLELAQIMFVRSTFSTCVLCKETLFSLVNPFEYQFFTILSFLCVQFARSAFIKDLNMMEHVAVQFVMCIQASHRMRN